jgi:hypothetical protein
MNMGKWLPILLCFCVTAVSAEMYKWEDEDGKVHYTDQPPNSQQAEELSLPPLNSYKAPDLGVSNQDSPEYDDDLGPDSASPDMMPGQEGGVAAYEKLTITSPKMNETIRNNDGIVPISFTLTPEGGLKEGDEYRLMLDGRPLEQGGETTLVNVDRGSHTVKLQVVDANGVPKLSSQAVIFHLHREADGKKTTDATQPDDNSDAYTPSDDADHSAEEDEGIVSDGSAFDPSNITDPEDTRDSVYDPESPGYDSGSSSSGNYNPSSTPNYSPNYTPNYNQR